MGVDDPQQVATWLQSHWIHILIGIGLAAAAGLKVFLPFLAVSAAAYAGQLTLPDNMTWLGSLGMVVILLTAATVEILAYFVPWLDNALDVFTTPAAAAVGTIVMASQIPGLDPKVQFGIAALVGGGTSLAVQLGTVAGRATSTASTGGAANPLVTAVEVIAASALTSYLLPGVALFVFGLALALLAIGAVLAYKHLDKLKKLLD